MPIPIDQALRLLDQLQTPRLNNLFAQAHAKHVLHEVQELPINFPYFDPLLKERVTYAAYGLLAAGCSLIEQGERAEGAPAVENAASLLQYIHGPFTKESRESAFHVFVAAMAFYAAGHYSRAFVAIRTIEEITPAALIIASYIRKDTVLLIGSLNKVILTRPPLFEDQADLDEWAITVAISRAVAVVNEFTLTGTRGALDYADEQLRYALLISTTGNHPSWWWVIRLLRLMFNDIRESSPWSILPCYFGGQELPSMVERYITLLALNKPPVIEFWASQREAFPLTLNLANRGAVINLRTSAGKTRVAELAILQTLHNNPESQILYIAPFRSLAFEVEHALASTFSWLGFGVSHLYGGSRVSYIDTELVAESAIIIATPEKARALFRADPEMFNSIKLVVMDEGHLIGSSERYVRNEVFVDHIRSIVKTTGARVLLLSAVLPNAEEIAEWVTGDPDAVVNSPWKPSAERFGLLRWNGLRVRIEWQGEVESFNPSFVEAKPLGFGRRRRLFPDNKNEAVAATAVRLSAIGPVMIFSGRAISVPKLAEAVLLALGSAPQAHTWPENEWRVFEAVCNEELCPDAIELRAARVGVVCHSARLSQQVRIALENLMHSKAPKIIIATTTLAQGVNIGISSVIIANPYTGKDLIDKRDFWNICGRAGRAFVDGEGKILYAIDDTREGWQIRRDEQLARSYFADHTSDRVESGLLFVIRKLKQLADQAGVSFEVLLELAANNDFLSFGDNATKCEEYCDFIDDALLALHEDLLVNPEGADPSIWVEQVFRDSLAVIQARSGSYEISTDNIIAFLQSRADWTLRKVPQKDRKAVVSSGLPLSVALRAQETIETFKGIADSCLEEETMFEALVNAVRSIEEWARAQAATVVQQIPPVTTLDTLRGGWLGGISLRELIALDDNATKITKDLYGYQLPWVIHAASRQLRAADDVERSDALDKIALLVELGVPTYKAAYIFLAGIRSRTAATELSTLDVSFGNSVSEIGLNLCTPAFVEQLYPVVSAETLSWLDLLVNDAAQRHLTNTPTFPPFTIDNVDNADLLQAREIDGTTFLCSIDGKVRVPVSSTEALPFNQVSNDPRIIFVRDGIEWIMENRDPRLHVAETD
jgi:hypothetical protein